MAEATIKATGWPNGTVVSAYNATGIPNWPGNPPGNAVATAVAANNSVTFDDPDLVDGAPYFAAAEVGGRWVVARFKVGAGSTQVPVISRDLESGVLETHRGETFDLVGELGTPVINVMNPVYGAQGDGATDDAAAIQGAIDAAADAGGGTVVLPAGTYIVKTALKLKDNVTLKGDGWGATIIKVGEKAGVSAIEANSNAVVNPTILDLQVDGNLAQNAGSEKPAVFLDCVHPFMQRVWIKNGYINLQTKMTTEDKSSTRPEDGIFKDIRLFFSKSFNWLFEGPHDSQVQNVLACTTEGINISVRKVSVWTDCHAYGTAEYAWQLRGGSLNGCIGEGATKAECGIQADGCKLWNCEFFSAGAKDGKVGIEFGDEEGHTAFTTLVSNVKIEGCTNGSLKFVQGTSNSRISGICSQANGNLASGTPSNKIYTNELSVTGGATDNINFRTKNITSTTVEIPSCRYVEITNTEGKELKKITATYVNHMVILRFKENTKVVKGENLKIKENFEATADDTLTLVCDGTNWYEIARSTN